MSLPPHALLAPCGSRTDLRWSPNAAGSCKRFRQVALVEAPDDATRAVVVARMEADALATADAILLTDGPISLLALLR